MNYDVLLSYPDYNNPNHLYILDKHGGILYATKGVSPPLVPKEQSAESLYFVNHIKLPPGAEYFNEGDKLPQSMIS